MEYANNKKEVSVNFIADEEIQYNLTLQEKKEKIFRNTFAVPSKAKGD